MKIFRKKLSKTLIAISSILLLAACSSPNPTSDEGNDQNEEDTKITEDDTEENYEVNQDLSAWMPRLDNVVYHYDGSGNEFAPFVWTPQFNEEDYYQITKDNGGTTTVEVHQYNENEIVKRYSQDEVYFRDNLTSIWGMDSFHENEILLKTPIAEGTSWENEETTNEITAINKEIELAAGNYQTIEVTSETDDTTIKRYYAEDVGLVYEKTESAGLTVESELAEIEENTPEKIPLTVYQTDDQLTGLEQIDAELILETNDPARLALEDLLHGNTENQEEISLLPEGTEINSLFLNQEGVVEADLSSEYIKNMNSGATAENFFLKGLVNTLTEYYASQELLLTIDGEPYQSGHYLLDEGETLSFDESLVNE